MENPIGNNVVNNTNVTAGRVCSTLDMAITTLQLASLTLVKTPDPDLQNFLAVRSITGVQMRMRSLKKDLSQHAFSNAGNVAYVPTTAAANNDSITMGPNKIAPSSTALSVLTRVIEDIALQLKGVPHPGQLQSYEDLPLICFQNVLQIARQEAEIKRLKGLLAHFSNER